MRNFEPAECSGGVATQMQLDSTPSAAPSTKPAPPPLWFWILPASVGLLRTVPFFWLVLAKPPPGHVYLKLGYIPKDFLSYLAFSRQVADTGAFVFANPFTTDPQSPRFILLFHWMIGVVSSITGHPNWVLELSRIPLCFLFFLVLWKFLLPILEDRRERLWACALVAFSGGIESFLQPFVGAMPAGLADQFRENTWEMFGWNTFAAFFNPLWIAALIPMLICLRPVFKPDGPRDGRELLQIGLGFLVTYLIHPYTAILLLAVVATAPVIEFVLRAARPLRIHGRIGFALAAPVLAVALLGRWQAQDTVYRVSASGIFGPQNLSVFWYPITFGVLGLAALRGVQVWFAQKRPYRFAVITWVIAVVLLHSSPVINGYKFAFLLHLPLCLLAAPVVSRLAQELFCSNSRARIVAVCGLLVLFGQVLVLPPLSVAAAKRDHTIPAEYESVTTALSRKAIGNVLASPDLGNILPAYTAHRVWVGHWFLTPNFARRANLYAAITENPERSNILEDLVKQEQIRYIVLPASQLSVVERPLGSRVVGKESFGRLLLLTLDPGK